MLSWTLFIYIICLVTTVHSGDPLQDLNKDNLNLVMFRIHGETNTVNHWTGKMTHTTTWESPVPGTSIVDFWKKWGLWDVIELLENTKIHKTSQELNRLIDGNFYKFRMIAVEKDSSEKNSKTSELTSSTPDVLAFIVNITDLATKSNDIDREFTKFKLSLVGILNHTVRHPLYNLNHDLQNIRDDLPMLMKTRRTPFERENGSTIDFESIYRTIEQLLIQIEHHVANVLRTHRIVETFLALQEKQLSLVSKTFDVVDLVKYVYDQYHALAQTKGIYYELVIEPSEANLSPVFKHDSDKLSFCLSALLENAIKFTPLNGVVTLYVTVSQSNLSFLVSDNGPGIPADRSAAVLKRIKQGDDFRIDNPDSGALGLSLMVVHKIVETLMHGKFSIHNHHSPLDSSTGGGQESASTFVAQGAFCYFDKRDDKNAKEGTTQNVNDIHGFSAHISIPIQRDIVKSYRSSEPTLERKGSIVSKTSTYQTATIQVQERTAFLIVDDDPQILKLMKKMLARLGHLSVFTADNGLMGAVEYQRHHREIRLIITDIQMPETTGYDLACKIRGYESSLRLTQVPIIAMSGGAIGDIRKKCIDVGCSEYILKPVSSKQLHEMIQRYAL